MPPYYSHSLFPQNELLRNIEALQQLTSSVLPNLLPGTVLRNNQALQQPDTQFTPQTLSMARRTNAITDAGEQPALPVNPIRKARNCRSADKSRRKAKWLMDIKDEKILFLEQLVADMRQNLKFESMDPSDNMVESELLNRAFSYSGTIQPPENTPLRVIVAAVGANHPQALANGQMPPAPHGNDSPVENAGEPSTASSSVPDADVTYVSEDFSAPHQNASLTGARFHGAMMITGGNLYFDNPSAYSTSGMDNLAFGQNYPWRAPEAMIASPVSHVAISDVGRAPPNYTDSSMDPSCNALDTGYGALDTGAMLNTTGTSGGMPDQYQQKGPGQSGYDYFSMAPQQQSFPEWSGH